MSGLPRTHCAQAAEAKDLLVPISDWRSHASSDVLPLHAHKMRLSEFNTGGGVAQQTRDKSLREV